MCQYIENITTISTQPLVTMAIYDENNRCVETNRFYSGHFVVNESRKKYI